VEIPARHENLEIFEKLILTSAKWKKYLFPGEKERNTLHACPMRAKLFEEYEKQPSKKTQTGC